MSTLNTSAKNPRGAMRVGLWVLCILVAAICVLPYLAVLIAAFSGSTETLALALPLALPAYVLAYGYTHILDHPGIVQSTLRDVMGWGPRDYWFPEIRSLGGAAAMLTFVLYPYVYLLARASFSAQSGSTFLAARVLGKSPWQAFLTVSLPLARPAIAVQPRPRILCRRAACGADGADYA